MDGSGLMESLLNSIKPLHVAVASLTVKLQIFANSTKLPKLQIESIRYSSKFVIYSKINPKFDEAPTTAHLPVYILSSIS